MTKHSIVCLYSDTKLTSSPDIYKNTTGMTSLCCDVIDNIQHSILPRAEVPRDLYIVRHHFPEYVRPAKSFML